MGLCCFYIAVKSSEEEKNVPLANDLIRISQNRFTVSDMMRMEKIIMEKLYWKVKAPTALHFLHLLHSHIQEQLSSERYKHQNKIISSTVLNRAVVHPLKWYLQSFHK